MRTGYGPVEARWTNQTRYLRRAEKAMCRSGSEGQIWGARRIFRAGGLLTVSFSDSNDRIGYSCESPLPLNAAVQRWTKPGVLTTMAQAAESGAMAKFS